MRRPPDRWLVAGAALLLAGAAVAGVLLSRRGRRVFVTYPAAEVAGVKDPHAFRGKPLCQACHAGETPQLQTEPVRLCQRCHTFKHKNHPVSVAMKKGLPPPDLPLGDGQLVVCHTCHDPHATKRVRWGLRLPFNTLCKRCHRAH